MPRIKPRVPVLRQGHPLARGLRRAWYFAEGAGQPRELVDSLTGTLGSGVSWTSGLSGPCLSFPGSSGGNVTGDTRPTDVPPWTMAFRVLSNSLSGDKAIVKDNAGGIGLYTTGSLLTYYYSAYNNGTTSLSANRWYHVACSCDGTNLVLYVDGQVDATYARNYNLPGQWNLGGASTENWPGLIDSYQVWTRALSASEIATLYTDPYALVKPFQPSLINFGFVVASEVPPASDLTGVSVDVTAVGSGTLATSVNLVGIGVSVTAVGSGTLATSVNLVGVGVTSTALGSGTLTASAPGAKNLAGVGVASTALGSGTLTASAPGTINLASAGYFGNYFGNYFGEYFGGGIVMTWTIAIPPGVTYVRISFL